MYIVNEIKRIVTENNIDLFMAELPTGSMNAKSAWLLGMSFGICMTYTTAFNFPFIPLTPMAIKHTVRPLCERYLGTQFGKGEEPSKEQIMEVVAKLFPTSTESFIRKFKNGRADEVESHFEHVSDSIIVFLTGITSDAFTHQVQEIINKREAGV